MRHRTSAVLVALAVALCAVPTVSAQSTRPSSADSAAIAATAMDYIEGFYTANPQRMEHALHPELAKRIIYHVPGQPVRFESITAATLVARTKGAFPTPAANQQKDLTILDVFQNVASVKIVANRWVDYLHMVKVDGEWKILNVLWELKPPPA